MVVGLVDLTDYFMVGSETVPAFAVASLASESEGLVCALSSLLHVRTSSLHACESVVGSMRMIDASDVAHIACTT